MWVRSLVLAWKYILSVRRNDQAFAFGLLADPSVIAILVSKLSRVFLEWLELSRQYINAIPRNSLPATSAPPLIVCGTHSLWFHPLSLPVPSVKFNQLPVRFSNPKMFKFMLFLILSWVTAVFASIAPRDGPPVNQGMKRWNTPTKGTSPPPPPPTSPLTTGPSTTTLITTTYITTCPVTTTTYNSGGITTTTYITTSTVTTVCPPGATLPPPPPPSSSSSTGKLPPSPSGKPPASPPYPSGPTKGPPPGIASPSGTAPPPPGVSICGSSTPRS